MALHLIDYNAIFIHIPKTGGTFVRHVLTEVLNLRTEEVGYKHSHPNLIGTIALEGKKLFAFVRDPVEWYKSYWAMKKWHLEHKTFGDIYESDLLWHPTWKIDRFCWSDDFETFVRNVEDKYPGFVKNMYDQYLSGVLFCGKQESLLTSLALILDELSIGYTDEIFRLERKNNNTGDKTKARYTQNLVDLVRGNNAVLYNLYRG